MRPQDQELLKTLKTINYDPQQHTPEEAIHTYTSRRSWHAVLRNKEVVREYDRLITQVRQYSK